jgi:hypothetical protein
MTNARLRFAERAQQSLEPWTRARFVIWLLLLMALAAWGTLIVTW